MGKFLNNMKVEHIGGKYRQMLDNLFFWSEIIELLICVPKGFIHDNESIPRLPFIYFLCGHTSDSAGALHDYLSCFDAYPIVTKATAAEIYLEACQARGTMKPLSFLKSNMVKVWPGYWHQRSYKATLADLTENIS